MVRPAILVLVLILSASACHPAAAPAPSAPRVVVRSSPPATPAPPPRPTYDEYVASLFGGDVSARAASAREPPKPDHERFRDEVAEARQRARAALDAASLRHLSLSETMFPVRESAQTWRFALMDPAPCQGACRHSGEGEQVGWLLVAREDEVTVETLGHAFDLSALPRVRAREERHAKALGKHPAMKAFCRWVVQQGADACTMWIEEAPAPDCSGSCRWQAYVGASNGVASSRHFTLLIDERTGGLTVRDVDGTEEPMARYRARVGF